MCEGISRHRGHVGTLTMETILCGWHHPISWKPDATEVKRGGSQQVPGPPRTHTPSTMVLCQKQFSQPTMLGISDTVTQNKLLLGVLVRVTVAGMKYQDQNSVGRKGFILAHTSRRLSIPEALMSGRELREGRDLEVGVD